jgi:hypothetical protein
MQAHGGATARPAAPSNVFARRTARILAHLCLAALRERDRRRMVHVLPSHWRVGASAS